LPYGAEICSHPFRVGVRLEMAVELHADVNETDDLRNLSRFDDVWEDGLLENGIKNQKKIIKIFALEKIIDYTV
jgi:hypothetical protein